LKSIFEVAMEKRIFLSAFCCLFLLGGCAVPQLPSQNSEQLTVAKAQREIRIGMTSSEVVEVLGSPNMVTTDTERRETWVYDKVSTNVQYSRNQGGVWLLLFGAGGSAGAVSQNQRTLTIIVKFNADGRVRDFAYRTSSF